MKNRHSLAGRGLWLAVGTLLVAQTPLLAAYGWTVNYKAALAQAKRTGKCVLVDFTGSDWCGWCVKLDKEVFNTRPFAKWAKENVILLKLDFPRRKRLPAALARQNKQLQAKYGVRGFPTVLFLDFNGGVIGKTGYMKGGAAAWIESANGIIAKAPKPEKLEPMIDFGEALETARKGKTPLLVLACSGTSRTGFKSLEEDHDFATFAKGRMVAVKIDTDKTAADTGGRKTYDSLQEKYTVRKYATQILLIDVAGDKLLYSAYTVPKSKTLIPRLRKLLPKPVYEGGWLENFEKAKDIATATRRPILMDFTGSDWCGWCTKLDKEVFATDDFKKFADAKLVLLKVDLPRKKKLPADLKKQNDALQAQYGVNGFPTLVLLDATGAEKKRMAGFPRGGVKQLLGWLTSR